MRSDGSLKRARALATALSLAALAALASCAVNTERAAETPATTPATAAPSYAEPGQVSSQTAAPATIDEALAELSRAEGEFGRAEEMLVAKDGLKSPSGMPAPATTPSAQPMPGTQPKQASEAELGAGNPCATACRALASMQRATDHLCGLAGDSDARCTGARDRVRGARERVTSSCACEQPG